MKTSIFNSRIKEESVTRSEKLLGYFVGPIGASLLTSILGSYLNVYYTDVAGIAAIGGGLFLATFPMVCKFIEAFMFIVMGRAVDRTDSPQGKARPWILAAMPAMAAGIILMFTVPAGGDVFRAAWVVVGYLLFYAIGNTAYGTSHALLVPLSTDDRLQRNSLSTVTNSVVMVSGTLIAVLFPSVILPAIGVDRGSWIAVVLTVTAISVPLFVVEYLFTKERVTASARGRSFAEPTAKHASLLDRLKLCIKSRQWVVLMIYMFTMNLFNALSNSAIFYYCNWVLGSYNDGITQLLFYAVGNAPLGFGAFLSPMLCKKLGRRNAMMLGFLLAAGGSALCLLAPTSMPLVLAGQAIKSIGLIPSAFMLSAMLADALDDVERASGERCDGFSASLYNISATLTSGIAVGAFNLLLTQFGYVSPASVAVIPTQNGLVQGFFVFCALGVPVICNAVLALLMWLSGDERKQNKIS